MKLKRVYLRVVEGSILLGIAKDNLLFGVKSKVFEFSKPLLLLSGYCLITCGIFSLSVGQNGYDPEPAEASNESIAELKALDSNEFIQGDDSKLEPIQDGDPENVCCIEAYPEQLFTSPAEPAFTSGPEGAIALDAERSNSSDEGLASGPALDPEGISPEDPEPLEPDYDDSLSRFAAGNLLRLIEGSFGALIMIASGIGAIVAAAFGAYKAAIALLFVAVGSFILRALVSLFFGTNYPAYDLQFVGGDGV